MSSETSNGSPMPTGGEPRFPWLLLIGALALVALAVIVLHSRYRTSQLASEVAAKQAERAKLREESSQLFDATQEYDKLLAESREREQSLLGEIVEYQTQLESLKNRTANVERLGVELVQLREALNDYDAAASEFRAEMSRLEAVGAGGAQ